MSTKGLSYLKWQPVIVHPVILKPLLGHTCWDGKACELKQNDRYSTVDRHKNMEMFVYMIRRSTLCFLIFNSTAISAQCEIQTTEIAWGTRRQKEVTQIFFNVQVLTSCCHRGRIAYTLLRASSWCWDHELRAAKKKSLVNLFFNKKKWSASAHL